MKSIRPFIFIRLSPQGQRQKQNSHQCHLKDCDSLIPLCPGAATSKKRSHHQRTDDGANSPEAMKKAGVPWLIMQDDIVIQRSIHTSAPQSIRQSPKTKLRKVGRARKSPKSNRSQRNRRSNDLPRPQPLIQPTRCHTGNDSTCINQHRDDPCIPFRDTQRVAHRRPSCSKNGVWQPQRYKRYIDKNKQKGVHKTLK